MLVTLQLHPDTPCKAVRSIEVDVKRSAERLLLRYVVVGDIDSIRWPAPAERARADELWKHTCFEAFVREEGEEAYREINLSPSGQWAAYAFDAYRAGVRPDANFQMQLAHSDIESTQYRLEADVEPGFARRWPWRLALSTIIEETSGAKSYWALAHPPGKPDFHHADGFVLDLAAREST